MLYNIYSTKEMVLPKMYFFKSNTELSQIVFKSLLLIYEHMAFVIFVSLHYLHILHSFTFPHFCQLTELHFCCISKFLSILCSFVSSLNTLVKLLAFLFRNTSTLYLFVALNSCLPRGNTATMAPNLNFTVPIWKQKLSNILCFCTGVCF